MKSPLEFTPLGKRVRVPVRLGRVTTIGAEAAAGQTGLSARGSAAIWTAAQALYRTGLHPGLSLVVRHRGEVVLNRALGHRAWGGEELMTPDTPTCLFSCSKAITSLVVHKLVEDDVLSLDEPVATYLPEFAANGKEKVTLRDLLTHRAGIASFPIPNPEPNFLFDSEEMVRLLCAAPAERHDSQAYHAATAGYILGEVVDRASGRTLPEVLQSFISEPLGLSTLTYGVPAAQRDKVALSYSTGPAFLPPLSSMVHRLLGIPAHIIAPAMNSAAGMDSVIPSAGLYASATDAAKVFQMLLDRGSWNGQQVLAEATIAEATRPAGPLVIDGSIPFPLRFSAGFMLGERQPNLFGINTPQAFGHLGFTNILCWADPRRQLSVALLTTGKAVSPEGFVAMLALSSAISAAVPR